MSSGTKNIIKSYLSQITVPDSVANYPGVKQTYLSADTSLQAPQVAAFDPNSNFTIELWYYPTNIGNFSWIAGKGGHFNGPPYVCYELIIDSSGKPGIQMSNSLTNNFYGLSANSPLTIGKWAHLAGTYDGSTLKFYVNGVLQSSIASSAGPIADITSNFMTNFSPAYMSQLRFWNVARTQSQIQQSMAEGVPSNKQGLVGCWLLNDGVGTTAKDSSGNNYDLTPTWNGSTVTWESPDLVNLYRTQLALHMIVASPDSAIQK